VDNLHLGAREVGGDGGEGKGKLPDGHEHEADSHKHRVCIENLLGLFVEGEAGIVLVTKDKLCVVDYHKDCDVEAKRRC
jgi:hypothetical protein